MAKVGDKYYFQSAGVTYLAEIVNVNEWREPSMKYAVDIYFQGKTVYEDVFFVGDEQIKNWKYIGNEDTTIIKYDTGNSNVNNKTNKTSNEHWGYYTVN